MKTIPYLQSSGRTQIFTYRWMPDGASAIVGAVQIAHGMVEHAARYERLPTRWPKRGYPCTPMIKPGHGRLPDRLDRVRLFRPMKNGLGKSRGGHAHSDRRHKNGVPEETFFPLWPQHGLFPSPATTRCITPLSSQDSFSRAQPVTWAPLGR